MSDQNLIDPEIVLFVLFSVKPYFKPRLLDSGFEISEFVGENKFLSCFNQFLCSEELLRRRIYNLKTNEFSFFVLWHKIKSREMRSHKVVEAIFPFSYI